MIATNTLRLLLIVLLLGLCTGPTPAQRKKQIAVLDFDFATVDLGLADRAYGGKQNLARRVADKLVTSLVGLGTCQVIERSQLEKVLSEQNLGTAGRIDASTAAKVGRILGVDALVIGNVSIFELQGMPGPNDAFWDNKKMRARIAVNFRVIDTTTAVVELSNEQTGMSSAPPKSTGSNKVANALGGFLTGGKAKQQDQEKVNEEIRDVVQQALEDTVSKITLDVEKYLSGALKTVEPTMTADKQVMGSIIEVNGPSLIITGIRKNAVRMGDRLFVRRGKVRRDPTSGREIRYSEKVGEVEVVEIQDEVIIGSFSGSGVAQMGDTVTNNPTAQALPSPNQATATEPTRSLAPSSTQPAPATNTTPRAVTPPATNNSSANNPPANNPAGRQTRTVTVSANLIWSDTGVDIQPGKLVELIATGAVKISPTVQVAAAGLINRPAPATLPLPGANIGALIARICSPDGQCSPLMVVGAQKQFNPAKAGRLILGINDGDTADNSGALSVMIKW